MRQRLSRGGDHCVVLEQRTHINARSFVIAVKVAFKLLIEFGQTKAALQRIALAKLNLSK